MDPQGVTSAKVRNILPQVLFFNFLELVHISFTFNDFGATVNGIAHYYRSLFGP
jgi:hypothetical protein